MALATQVVDTSAWIDFFANGNERLRLALEQGRVFIHPWVMYELELGSGVPRSDQRLLARLPRVAKVSDEDAWRIALPIRGTGVGWVDVHILASAEAAGFSLMAVDEPLRRAARRIGVPVAR